MRGAHAWPCLINFTPRASVLRENEISELHVKLKATEEDLESVKGMDLGVAGFSFSLYQTLLMMVVPATLQDTQQQLKDSERTVRQRNATIKELEDNLEQLSEQRDSLETRYTQLEAKVGGGAATLNTSTQYLFFSPAVERK